MAAISRLFVYPVKSLGGIAVDQRDVDQFGLHLDRRWMILNEAGEFLTQRWRPRLALVRTAVTPDHEVRLHAPDMPDIVVPQGGGPARDVVVWNDGCVAQSCGIDADRWVSAFLGEPCRIVFMPDSTRRPTVLRHNESLGQVGFADAYPFLLLSEASIDDLNARVPSPLPVNRFRPNIVVSGIEAYAEDDWDTATAGAVDLVMTKRCVRCVLTTIDQETAQAGSEPLRTLATYRRADGGVVFGVNLAHRTTGRLAVGDPVSATLRG